MADVLQEVEVIHDNPPNIDVLRRVFPEIRFRAVYFAYAPVIYSPSGEHVPDELLGHEMEHIVRQHGDPDGWWQQYAENVDFRREEELAAHAVEYQDRVRMAGDNRRARRRMLALVAERLASPIYGPVFNKKSAMVALKTFV